ARGRRAATAGGAAAEGARGPAGRSARGGHHPEGRDRIPVRILLGGTGRRARRHGPQVPLWGPRTWGWPPDRRVPGTTGSGLPTRRTRRRSGCSGAFGVSLALYLVRGTGRRDAALVVSSGHQQ